MWSQSILGKLKSSATQILHKYTVNPLYYCFTIFILVAIVVFWCRYVIKTYNVLLHLFYKHITCEYINSLNHTASLILSEATSWCLSRAVTNLHIEAELLYSQHYSDILKTGLWYIRHKYSAKEEWLSKVIKMLEPSESANPSTFLAWESNTNNWSLCLNMAIVVPRKVAKSYDEVVSAWYKALVRVCPPASTFAGK